MSRSSYERTSKTASGNYDRDYDERKERERDRTKSAYRDDSETRHHGKWTASGEASDLENASLPAAYGDARKSSHLGPRSFSDREYNNDQSHRSRSASYGNYDTQYNQYDNYDNYGYGAVPNPPPMPPRDFWRPQSHYRQSHPYYPQFGHSSYDGNSFAGMQHQQSGHHLYQGSGNLNRDIQAHAAELMHTQGAYGGYGSRDLGYGHPGYGQQSYGMSSYGSHPAYSHQSYQYLNSGYPHDQGLYDHDFATSTRAVSMVAPVMVAPVMGASHLGASSRHLELGTTRPHVDIYELGNEYIIELDMPGHTRDHIETKLFGNELVISSRPPKRDFKFHINERPLGRHEVTRKFYLPTDVNTTKIGATLTNGVLRVVLPRGAPASATVPSTTTVIDTTGTTTTTTQAVVV